MYMVEISDNKFEDLIGHIITGMDYFHKALDCLDRLRGSNEAENQEEEPYSERLSSRYRHIGRGYGSRWYNREH